MVKSKSGLKMTAGFKFFDRVIATVGPDYEVVGCHTLIQMGIIVMATKAVAKRCSDVEVIEEATGAFGVVGNKGGQVVKLRLDKETTLCFVSSHLAAHSGEKHREHRNSNVQEIMLGCRVGNKMLDLASQFTHTFWMGDLNYRIDLNYMANRKGRFIFIRLCICMYVCDLATISV
jgi:hypothetical protein